MSVLLVAWGICAIFDYVSNRKNDYNPKSEVAFGINNRSDCGIAAAVLSVLAIFIPAIYVMVDVVILYLFLFWPIISGVFPKINAVQLKKTGGSSV